MIASYLVIIRPNDSYRDFAEGLKVLAFYDAKDATTAAIRNAHINGDREFSLWRLNARSRSYIYSGTLYREFAHDFDKEKCWRK